jgi:hypothetical protein
VAPAQRRLDALQDSGTAQRRLGAYGWVDNPAPGQPGPTPAGLLHAPSPSAALASAVLRDRAVSDSGSRWDLNITSRTARVADRLAEHVRIGAHLTEALGREVERIIKRTPAIEELRHRFPVRSEHAGKRVCDGLRILAQDTFPVPLDPGQEAALQDLRDGLDAYGDLLVADAVHNLIEGRAEIAGAVMDAAAGLSRPPDLSLLHTPREGRAAASSVVLALTCVADTPLPPADGDQAVLSPTVTLDPSVAAYLAAQAGAAPAWDFEVSLSDETLPARPNQTVHLTDLRLRPADTLALTRTRMERLAVEWAAELDGVDLDAPGVTGTVVGGTAGNRYEHAVSLVSLIGRNPADARALSQDASAEDTSEGIDASLLARYLAARTVGAALARRLRGQVALLGPGGQIGGADPVALRQLVTACTAWGIAPDPPTRSADPTGPPVPPEHRRLQRLADTAPLALAALDERLTAAPDAAAASHLSRAEFLDAAAALISPTGQVAITGTTPVGSLPGLERADSLDTSWLTVAATVRTPLARLEAHQLTAAAPLRSWTNRPSDPWQTDPSDPRRLVVVYAVPQLDLAATSPQAPVAVAAIDRFSEVIPAAEQPTGAAFGFNAPAARAPQAILLAVPPNITKALNQETLARILADTRELAHARMARPVDLDEQYWGLAPSGLLPMSGATATPLEEHR